MVHFINRKNMKDLMNFELCKLDEIASLTYVNPSEFHHIFVSSEAEILHGTAYALAQTAVCPQTLASNEEDAKKVIADFKQGGYRYKGLSKSGNGDWAHRQKMALLSLLTSHGSEFSEAQRDALSYACNLFSTFEIPMDYDGE